jgi:hypothetical protein
MSRQLAAVRVPIPVVILLCLAVVGGFWWHGTRDTDFLKPPSEAELESIRNRVKAEIPRSDHAEEPTVPGRPPRASQPPPPAKKPPILSEYADEAFHGSAHLIQLATELEANGEFQRALLAWERVLDSTTPDEPQMESAISAIKRLRPTLPDWNKEAATGIPVSLQAGTGEKSAPLIEPQLAALARDIEHASAGILRVTSTVNAGRDPENSGDHPAPVALWLAGPNAESRSTDVLSFTLVTPENLPVDLRTTVYQLIRSHLATVPGPTTPPELREGTDAADALQSHITRFHWQQFGSLLNQTPEDIE